MKLLRVPFLVYIVLSFADITSICAQTGGKTMVRLYDAMPQTEAASRLGVWIGEKKIVSDITPGETSFFTEISSSATSITVKDVAGTTTGGLDNVDVRPGVLLSAILTENGEKVALIPVITDPRSIKVVLSDTNSVFIPANLSPNIEYTFELQTRDNPPKITSVTIKPFQSTQFSVNLDKVDWKLTGKLGEKTFAIPSSRFPPLELLKNRAAILMLPRAGDISEIVVLNAIDDGFILMDR